MEPSNSRPRRRRHSFSVRRRASCSVGVLQSRDGQREASPNRKVPQVSFHGPFLPFAAQDACCLARLGWLTRGRITAAWSPFPSLGHLAEPSGPSLCPALRTCGHHSLVPQLVLWHVGSHPPFFPGLAVEWLGGSQKRGGKGFQGGRVRGAVLPQNYATAIGSHLQTTCLEREGALPRRGEGNPGAQGSGSSP